MHEPIYTRFSKQFIVLYQYSSSCLPRTLSASVCLTITKKFNNADKSSLIPKPSHVFQCFMPGYEARQKWEKDHVIIINTRCGDLYCMGVILTKVMDMTSVPSGCIQNKLLSTPRDHKITEVRPSHTPNTGPVWLTPIYTHLHKTCLQR